MKFFIFSALVIVTLTACSSEEDERLKLIMDEFTEAGNSIAKVSFEAINGNLKAAINNGGVDSAIQFCSINALPLTDSLSIKFNAQIKRTSLKLRNPDNQPDSLEAYMLDLYAQIEKMQKPMVAKTLLSRNSDVRFFAPIILQGQCLKCHGTVGTDISENTYAIIKTHYPDDQAIDFKEGKLRGIWSINFGNIDELQKAEPTHN